jgi:hypothetical protein
MPLFQRKRPEATWRVVVQAEIQRRGIGDRGKLDVAIPRLRARGDAADGDQRVAALGGQQRDLDGPAETIGQTDPLIGGQDGHRDGAVGVVAETPERDGGGVDQRPGSVALGRLADDVVGRQGRQRGADRLDQVARGDDQDAPQRDQRRDALDRLLQH